MTATEENKSPGADDSPYRVLELDKVLGDLARRAHCSAAADRLRRLRPLESLDLIQVSLKRISEVRTFLDSGGSVPLDPFEDIRRHLKSASVEGSYLEPQAFDEIHTVLVLSARAARFLKEHAFPRLHEVAAGLAPLDGLATEIARAIDLKALEVRDGASPVLAGLRRELARSRERVRRHLEELLDRLTRQGVLQERLITMRSGRWVLPIKETHRHLVAGLLHDKSASGATAFVEPLETLEQNNQIRRLEAEEREEVRRILRRLTDLVRRSLPELENNFEVLVGLDCVYAAALTSRAFNQHEPRTCSPGEALAIRQGRHPLLVLRGGNAVPLNLELGGGVNTLVITGPNAGGKTVALKTVGLLSLLFCCGLHVPASGDSSFPFFRRIFAHVGDAQSIEMDLSTFSAHIKGIKTILEEARAGDLVLIDEIGAGTDPQEGAALAMAVLEALTARDVATIVTTHHGALKAFAHETPGIANGSMAFDSRTLAPSYEFRPGLPGSSYALEIAERMGIPAPIISRSRLFTGPQANRLETLLLNLEMQAGENRSLEQTLQQDKRVVDGLKRHYEEQTAQLARESRDLRRKAAEEARAIVEAANSLVERAIRTVREEGATKEAIREAKSVIQSEREFLQSALAAEEPPEASGDAQRAAENLAPGDQVRWKRTGSRGIVLSPSAAADRVLVSFGHVKVQVAAEELRRTSGARPSEAKVALSVSTSAAPSVQEIRIETDVRGLHVEEALKVVDKFVDKAALAGLREVRVIHGVGTGALRSSIVPFLQAHPLVIGVRPGGDDGRNRGMTVVTLRE